MLQCNTLYYSVEAIDVEMVTVLIDGSLGAYQNASCPECIKTSRVVQLKTTTPQATLRQAEGGIHCCAFPIFPSAQALKLARWNDHSPLFSHVLRANFSR